MSWDHLEMEIGAMFAGHSRHHEPSPWDVAWYLATLRGHPSIKRPQKPVKGRGRGKAKTYVSLAKRRKRARVALAMVG
jgi:hypothetical protein